MLGTNLKAEVSSSFSWLCFVIFTLVIHLLSPNFFNIQEK